MNDIMELRKIFVAIRRRWWLLFLGAAVGAALGYLISQRLAPVYRSTSTLIVGQSIKIDDLERRDFQTSAQLAVEYAAIAERQPVLQRTVEALELDSSWQQLRGQVKATPLENTRLLEISVEADSPGEAQAIANEMADQLVQVSARDTQGREDEGTSLFVQERLDVLQEQIENGQRRIEALEAAMSRATLSPSEIRSLQGEIDTLQGLITGWEDNYAQLLNIVGANESTNYLAVLEEAQASSTPVRPRVELNILVAATLGLALALGLAALLENLDDRVKSIDDLGQAFGLPVLGTVGRIQGQNDDEKLITALGPFSPASEAYRMIRSNLQFRLEEGVAKAILVTSPTACAGKSLTTANLGIAMAQVGLRTVIVDADLRNPAQHRIFDTLDGDGLTELLHSQAPEINGSLRYTGIDCLYLLTSGDFVPRDHSDLLSSGYTEHLLERLTEVADVIILDGPPLLSVADAAVLANRVDGVVMVIEASRTGKRSIRQAISILRDAEANLLGAVLNRGPGPQRRSYRVKPTSRPTDEPD
ncbi:MAG TPA: polysaccharide biosynthesis tyrosine autokinase [Candidatus Binatia bacterium]|nr:polysaccharide biosynthesis tyrosine autokinase [Candidatus Binatia bacterium]